MSEGGSSVWLDGVRKLLDQLEATQGPAIEALAIAGCDSISGGGIVHVAGTGHSAIIPLEKTNVVDEQEDRYNEIRDTSEAGLSGVDVFLSGPEGFVVDISNVFAGANITLLIVTASVVILLLLITYHWSRGDVSTAAVRPRHVWAPLLARLRRPLAELCAHQLMCGTLSLDQYAMGQ
jgi:hypothetical protein